MEKNTIIYIVVLVCVLVIIYNLFKEKFVKIKNKFIKKKRGEDVSDSSESINDMISFILENQRELQDNMCEEMTLKLLNRDTITNNRTILKFMGENIELISKAGYKINVILTEKDPNKILPILRCAGKEYKGSKKVAQYLINLIRNKTVKSPKTKANKIDIKEYMNASMKTDGDDDNNEDRIRETILQHTEQETQRRQNMNKLRPSFTKKMRDNTYETLKQNVRDRYDTNSDDDGKQTVLESNTPLDIINSGMCDGDNVQDNKMMRAYWSNNMDVEKTYTPAEILKMSNNLA